MTTSDTGIPDNAQTLRARIDRGETRDKVAAADPAASPLGTDSEAAGVAPEAGRGGPATAEATATVARSGDAPPRTWMTPRRLLAITAAAIVAAVILGWWQVGG